MLSALSSSKGGTTVMSGQLEQVVTDFLAALDSLDVDAMLQGLTEDAQGVDEISRRWIRGRVDLSAYIRQLASSVSSVRTEATDVSESIFGDVGVVTCWLDQTYTLEGQEQSVSAPTTIVFRNEWGEWKLSLFHSVPLPEQE
jgi:ketosteroid isomerase-like protein